MDDIHAVFQQLCGIDTRDVAVPHRLLKLPPNERNAHTINQAAAQLITHVQSLAGRIPATYSQWMIQNLVNARNAMLSQVGPSTPVPPPVPVQFAQSHQAPVWQPSGNPPAAAAPSVLVRPTGYGRRKDSRAETFLGVLAIVVTMAGAGLLGFVFRDQLFGSGRDAKRPRPVPPAPPVVVAKGGGAADSRRGPPPAPSPAGPEEAPKGQRGDGAEAQRHLTNAVKNLRKGFFDEADLDAQKALAAAPDMEEAEAMRLTAAYVRQYTSLAEDARKSLNESSEVDLGPKWGRGAFIEQDDESVTFRVKGKNKRFTIPELDVIPGARFRITASFLDNAAKPANDLILGSYQFVKRLDSEGVVIRRGANEAPSRWLKASTSQESATAEQARILLRLAELEFDG